MKKLLLAALMTQSAWAGIYEPHTLWDKKDIVTCFYSQKSHLNGTNLVSYSAARKAFDFRAASISTKNRELIKYTVNLNYTAERTGIRFVGFKDCAQTPNPDLVVLEAKNKFLIFGPDFNGMGVIGESGEYTNDANQRGFFGKSGTIATISLNAFHPTTIVHEFGHVTGLRHEHSHPDSHGDKSCQTYLIPSGVRNTENREQVYDTAIIATDYDRQSIMNYCYYMNKRPEIDKPGQVLLSKKDIEALQEMYR